MSSLQLPTSMHRKSSSQTLHMEHAYESLPEVLPVNMTSSAPSRSLTTNSKCDNKDLAGLALLLGDPLDLQNCPIPSPSFQRDHMKRAATDPVQPSIYSPPRHRSIYHESNQHLPYRLEDSISDLSLYNRNTYTPSSLSSNVSNPLHHRHSSVSILSSTMQTPNQHHKSYSNNYPGQLVWTNSSSTTVSIVSPDYSENNFAPTQPIAELDTSPYQKVPMAGAINYQGSLSDPKMAVQVNTTPVELPAEERQPAKHSLCRKNVRLGSSRSGCAFSEPVSTLNQQHRQRHQDRHSGSVETGNTPMQSRNSTW